MPQNLPPRPLPRFEFVAALLLSVVLLAISIPTIGLGWMPVAFSSAILAAGIGVLLYAFGSHVTFNMKGLMAAGCAAVAFGVYYLIHSQYSTANIEIEVVSEGPPFSHPKASIGASHQLLTAPIDLQFNSGNQREETKS
jgi:hypothetical protein